MASSERAAAPGGAGEGYVRAGTAWHILRPGDARERTYCGIPPVNGWRDVRGYQDAVCKRCYDARDVERRAGAGEREGE